MLTRHLYNHRTYLLIAGTVGLIIAAIVTARIWIPTLGLLAQFSQFSPLARAAIVIRLLSPVTSFLLVTGWIWTLLRCMEWVSFRLPFPINQNQVPPIEEPVRRTQNSHCLEPVNPSEEAMKQDLLIKSKAIVTRAITAPPLFQLDRQNPWLKQNLPMTPLSGINQFKNTSMTQKPTTIQEHSQEEDLGHEEKAENKEPARINHTELVTQPQVADTLTQEEAPEKSTIPIKTEASFSLPQTETAPPVTLTLLKQVRAWVRADDGTTLEVKLRGGENAIRLIQLAYIAWRKGTAVDRDKMLTYVLSRGKRRDLTSDQLGEVFDAAKRYLRQDLDRAINELKKNGHPISPEIDFFSNEPGFYWLHPSCKVIDLETIEEYYRTIQTARKEGLLDEKLDGSLPDWVVEACQNLTRAYPGDFLQSLLEKFPEEFGPWVKEPVTLYRDRYLDALLILANYESALGRNFHDDALNEVQNEEQRRHHISRAAQLFYDYAMYAINSRWDQKLKFAYRAGKDGERVIRSARALRRCIVELGKLGNPDMIDQVYLSFKERMSMLSEGTWKPDKDTESDVAEAKRTTGAYRFASQIPASPKREKQGLA
jgi:hypothetical protein